MLIVYSLTQHRDILFPLTLEKNFLSNSSEILGTMLGEILSELFSVKLM